jgi:hypothetical protein
MSSWVKRFAFILRMNASSRYPLDGKFELKNALKDGTV